MNDLVTRQSVLTMLQKIENAVEDGDGFQFNEWVEYAKDIPAENTYGDLQKEIDFWHIKCTEYEQTIAKMAVELNDVKAILGSAEKTTINPTKTTITDTDLISRAEAVECCFNGWNKDFNEIAKDIKNLPAYSAEEPIKHFGSIECPNCGRLLMLEEPLRIKVENPEIKVDLISREEVLEELNRIKNEKVSRNVELPKIDRAINYVAELPTYSAEQSYSWCGGCKEYDTENHCCHRYSSFIRESLQENINAVLEDIKAEIEKEIISGDSVDYINGLNMALMIINEKYISGEDNK